MLIAALVLIAPNWKQHSCPSTGEWRNDVMYPYDRIFFHSKKDEVLTTWVNLSNATLSKRSQTQIPYSTYMKCPKGNFTYKVIETKSRSVVTWGLRTEIIRKWT